MKKQAKKRKTHIPLRLNMLFFIVFLLFAALILRLGFVQIVHGEDAKREIERTEDITVNTSVPRGLIFDRNYKPVVENEPQRAISYTAPKKFDQEEALETAEELSKLIEPSLKKITERDKVDFWLIKNPEKAKKLVTDKELEKYKGKNDEIYRLQRERVTEEDLKTLTEEDLKVLAVYREFISGYALTPQLVKNADVTPEEFARVSERLTMLPGVDTTTDWTRTYANEKAMRSILGSINEMPIEKLDYYMARGYSRNDRVGTSYLEQQYEDVLRGQKAKIKNVTRSGSVLETKVIHEGQRGNDLVLTVDLELQEAVEKIIEEELQRAKTRGGTNLLDRAFVVMMDPHTGEILTMAGKQYARDEDGNRIFRDFASGAYTTAYVPGSVVKGASVMTGLMTGVIQGNSTLLDEPLMIKGTGKKSSVFNRGGNNMYMTPRQALVRSSNVFMYKLAIAVGNGQYRRDQPLIIDKDLAFKEMRNHFNQFGLGVRTGIDLPGELAGYQGNADLAGKILDFSIGQYDTYTPLQLAQYVSTIANGGYRMQPRIVKEIREPDGGKDELGPVAESIEPKVLNKINATDQQLKVVQEGFWGVIHDPRGTGRALNTDPYRQYRMAAKTGTAETFDQGQSVWNLSLVAYAPYENPEIAMAVVVPSAYLNTSDDRYKNTINMDISKRVIETYFQIKKDRAEGKDPSADGTAEEAEEE